MMRSILVPLDGLTFGEHALPMAAALARRAGATLHLVHVHQGKVPVAVEGFAVLNTDDLHARQDETSYLADVARRVAEKGPVTLKTALMEGGDVVDGLKNYVKRESIDLVVMSTHARGAFGRFWLGSVADDLAHEMDRPLLLIRPQEGKPDLHRDFCLHSILVPLDGTMLAEQALEPAVELGKLFDAELDLVRVNLPPIMPTYLPEGAGSLYPPPEPIAELQKREEEEARNYLGGVAARMTAGGARVRTHVIKQESPAAGILTEAKADHADLIAMETHGRRGLARLFLGSVADEVLRGGAAPVLLHRATPRR